MVQDLERIVLRVAKEVAEAGGRALPEDLGRDTRLFGKDGLFDSLGLVSLLVGVEEAISDELGRDVTLADERALSRSRSPFRSVGTLAEYAHELVTEAGG